jgi:hypothetical protein
MPMQGRENRKRQRPAGSDAPLLRQRLAAIFLTGLMLWFSPLMLGVAEGRDWHGVPLLYLYLFASWMLLILLAALVLSRSRD